jgi:hypothetical protein
MRRFWRRWRRAARGGGAPYPPTRPVEVANPFVDRLDERSSTADHYPDVVAAGSLAAALDSALRVQGSSLVADRGFYGAESASFASVSRGNRHAQINIAARERLFLFDLWAKEIQLAKGQTSDLAGVASTIRRWLEDGRSASDVALEFRFVWMTESGASYERGTYVEDTWQRFLERGLGRRNNDTFHWDELERFIRLASERTELRRLLPYTSLFRFSVTPRSRPPDNVVPVVWPLGNGRFMLTPYWGGELLAEGDAEHVLEAFVDSVRDLPAWRHNVEDVQ